MTVRRPEVVCLANQKGGVGKSTTAAVLATGLIRRGERVLVVDLDSQANISSYADPTLVSERVGAKQVMSGEASWEEAVRPTPLFDVVAPGAGLDGLNSDPTAESWMLMEAIERMGAGRWDWVVVDTKPSLGTVTRNALYASDRIVIPTKASTWSTEGMARLKYTLDAIERHFRDVPFEVTGLLITLMRNTVEHRAWEDEVRAWGEQAGVPLLGAVREGVKVEEAQSRHVALAEYAPESPVCRDYEAFVDRFLAACGREDLVMEEDR